MRRVADVDDDVRPHGVCLRRQLACSDSRPRAPTELRQPLPRHRRDRQHLAAQLLLQARADLVAAGQLALADGDDLRLVGQVRAVQLQLAADGAVVLRPGRCRRRATARPGGPARASARRGAGTRAPGRRRCGPPRSAPAGRRGRSARSPPTCDHAEVGVLGRERDSRRSRAWACDSRLSSVDLPALGRPTRPASAMTFSSRTSQRSSPGVAGLGLARGAVGRRWRRPCCRGRRGRRGRRRPPRRRRSGRAGRCRGRGRRRWCPAARG